MIEHLLFARFCCSLDIEEAIAEEKKNRDAFVKDLEALGKKLRIIETAVKNAEQELEAFQVRNPHKTISNEI